MSRFLYYISVLFECIVLFQLITFNGEGARAQQPQLPRECGKLNEKLFYNGKSITALNEYPWLGLLGFKEPNYPISYNCVAVLISQRYVVVPAHCITDKNADALSVIFGDWRVDNNIHLRDCDRTRCAPPPKVYYLEEVIPHFQFVESHLDNDIGLAKVKENVQFSDYVQPICLPPANERDDQYIGQRLEIAGYPFKYRPDFDVNSFRMKTVTHMTSFEYCQSGLTEQERTELNMSTKQMCGFVLGGKALISGSAVMGVNVIDGKPKSFYLMGILTFGKIRNDLVDLDSPTWFQRVSPYRDLILQNMT
ncbi:CLIP domain-containing serine protease HP8-like [Drosophila tropicalis]|uniref:CLIP domain-containing serine protease HP8-like n=1 Tax=Drosophila tropicalis TaxID=46794 RepID=UPI0035AB98FB